MSRYIGFNVLSTQQQQYFGKLKNITVNNGVVYIKDWFDVGIASTYPLKGK